MTIRVGMYEGRVIFLYYEPQLCVQCNTFWESVFMFKYLLKGKSMCHFLEKKTTNYITLCDVLSYICFGQWSVEDEFHSLGNEAAA